MTRFRFSLASLVAAVVVSAVGVAALHDSSKWWFSGVPESASMTDHEPFSLGEELKLIEQIRTTMSAEQRSRLISKLEKLPVDTHPFYSRWCLMNDLDPFSCWTDDGYDPSLSNCPRDIQLLIATDYGKSDIENGGFHQFFSNPTGVLAPEMIEWFERAGLAESASVLRGVWNPQSIRTGDLLFSAQTGRAGSRGRTSPRATGENPHGHAGAPGRDRGWCERHYSTPRRWPVLASGPPRSPGLAVALLVSAGRSAPRRRRRCRDRSRFRAAVPPAPASFGSPPPVDSERGTLASS